MKHCLIAEEDEGVRSQRRRRRARQAKLPMQAKLRMCSVSDWVTVIAVRISLNAGRTAIELIGVQWRDTQQVVYGVAVTVRSFTVRSLVMPTCVRFKRIAE